MRMPHNWHRKHLANRSLGDVVADRMAAFVGSWTFVIWLSATIVVWIGGNAWLILHFDPFPFILLNLVFSAQATYSTPLIMMAQNRAAERDREMAEHDYMVNEGAKEEIEMLITKLDAMDQQKLDKIIEMLERDA
jgi:uncharacterized membrane protein